TCRPPPSLCPPRLRFWALASPASVPCGSGGGRLARPGSIAERLPIQTQIKGGLMRFSLRSAIDTVTAVTFAAIGGALVSTGAAAAPVISVNGTDITAGLNCGGSGKVIECSQPGATFVGNGFSLSNWDFIFNLDPNISGSFTLTNLTPGAQTFSVS